MRIDLRMSQTELGTLTGMTRESMNKQLAEWRGDGLIDTEGGLITIHDRQRFQRLVDEPPD